MKNLPFFGWEVSSGCNHDCVYCFNDSGTQGRIGCPSDEELSAVSDFLVSQRPVSVTVSGGEALMLFDRLRPHMEKFRGNRIQVRILSNGSLITEEIARFCAAWDIDFLISFPSADRAVFGAVTGQAGSYEQVLAGMDLLKKHGAAFQPNIVVTAANLDTLEDTVRFLWRRYAPPSVMVSRATVPAGAGADILDILLSSEQLERMFDICTALSEQEGIPLKTCGGFALCSMNSQKCYEIFGKACGGGLNSCLITTAGDVRVCARDSHAYGNIFQEPFDEIRGRMAAWRNAPVPEDCRGCPVAEICRGGCHMSSAEPTRGPGSLDCHARPQEPLLFQRRRKSAAKKIRLLRRYRIIPFAAVEESGCVRLSVGIEYAYFPKEIAGYLGSHETITLLSMLLLSPRKARPIMRKLLRIGLIQE